MSKTRSQKERESQTLLERLGRMKSVIFSSYQGLKVPEVTALRKELRSQGVDFQVVKKTLLQRALDSAGKTVPELPSPQGGLALVFGYDDEVLPAKLLDTYRKTHPVVEFQGGIIGDQHYSAQQITALAKLPSRQELLAKAIGSMKSPLSGLVNVSIGPMRGLVQALKAIAEKAPA